MNTGIGTCFATPSDYNAYRKAKAEGKTDEEAFAMGDNCIGCWGDRTNGSQAICALPPETMAETWGSLASAKHKPVLVTYNGKSFECIVGDVMPHRANITNGAIIDMNPALCAGLGLPDENVSVIVTWGQVQKAETV